MSYQQTIFLAIDNQDLECEVEYDYTEAEQPTRLEPGCNEEFEIIKLTHQDAEGLHDITSIAGIEHIKEGIVEEIKEQAAA